MRSAYILFNAAILLSLLGTVVVRVRFWQRWRSLVRGMLLVSVPFIVWDMYAVAAGHWSFNPAYTLPFRLNGLPIEELLFFVSVPLACMFVWTVIERYSDRQIIPIHYARIGLSVAAILMLVIAAYSLGHTYTRIVFSVAALTCVLLMRFSYLIVSFRYWVYLAVTGGLFVISNSVLTVLPITRYGQDAILGLYVGTIPIEDFVYNFVFLNLFLLVFHHGSLTKVRYHSRTHEKADDAN